MRKLLALLCFTCLWISIAPAYAEEIKEDIIHLRLTQESWIQAKTAKVIIAINASVRPKESDRVKKQINQALTKISNGEWHFTRFNTSRDQTGTETWHVLAEKRIATTLLADLDRKLRPLSKPGLQFKLGSIQSKPESISFQSTFSAMRQALIKKAMREKMTLQASMPGKKLRLKTIRFHEMNGPHMGVAEPYMMEAAVMHKSGPRHMRQNNKGSEGYALPLSTKVFLSADIEFVIVK